MQRACPARQAFFMREKVDKAHKILITATIPAKEGFNPVEIRKWFFISNLM